MENDKIMKLNVGCGLDYREGWINLDRDKDANADVVFDLSKLSEREKLPFSDNYFERIIMFDVLEHFFDPLPILKELYRVCKIGGTIEIKVPYGVNSVKALEHRRIFVLGSFNTHSFETTHSDAGVIRLNIKEIRIYSQLSSETFLGKFKKFYYNFFLSFINLLIKRSVAFYDDTFLNRLLPNTNIYAKYVKVK
ncbi:MAG: class I SAM-dependent methyltransferase [Nanoarchaeota archaeon]|nr:class I SAM-dependent methyltransferase [Nanoarchaeota archaeon]